MSHVNESCHVCMSHVMTNVFTQCCDFFFHFAHLRKHYFFGLTLKKKKSCHDKYFNTVLRLLLRTSDQGLFWSMNDHWVTSQINTSCQRWMRHVPYEWVMSHMNEACHTWMSHVIYEWVTSRPSIFPQCRVLFIHTPDNYVKWMSHVTDEKLMSHMKESSRMRHFIDEWVTSYMNEPCHTYEWVMSPMNESCHVDEWVMSHIWMSNVTYEWVMSHMNESCHMYEWGMSHMNESCHKSMSHVTYEWVMSHIWMSHITYEWVMSHMNESCYTWMSHVTYECVMSHLNASWHICMSHVTYEWVMSLINESRHDKKKLRRAVTSSSTSHTWQQNQISFWTLFWILNMTE